MAAAMTKRKRAAVSYRDDNAELDELLGLEDDAVSVVCDGEQDDGDGEYGPSKKLAKKSFKRARMQAASAKKQQPKSAKPFPFLQLPAELRDTIYELALTEPYGISLISHAHANRRSVRRGPVSSKNRTAYYHPRHRYRTLLRALDEASKANLYKSRSLVPALLGVCQQIYREAVGYLYQQEIIVEDTYVLHNFLADIGRNRSQLTNITIAHYGTGRGAHKAMNFCGLTLLAECIRLRTLEFDCALYYFRQPERLARQVYRDAYHFVEAYALAKGGDKAAAVDVLRLHECNFQLNSSSGTKEEYTSRFRETLMKLIR